MEISMGLGQVSIKEGLKENKKAKKVDSTNL